MGGRRLNHEKANRRVVGPVDYSEEIFYDESVDDYELLSAVLIDQKRSHLKMKNKVKNCPKDFVDFQEIIKRRVDMCHKIEKFLSVRLNLSGFKSRKITDLNLIEYEILDHRLKFITNTESNGSSCSYSAGSAREYADWNIKLPIKSLDPNEISLTTAVVTDILQQQLASKKRTL